MIKGDLKAALDGAEHELVEVVTATHAGMSTVEFGRIVEDWIATARHPQTGKRFTDMVYQPMLELLAYLSANGFRNYIVTGGGIEFVRQWGERVYGVTPEQVIGSSIKTRFELRDGKPVLMRLPHLNFNNDKAGKPVTIHQHIGRAPLAAFGNSVGDQQMLEYTLGGGGARFGLLVLHDDAAREYAYGPVLGLPTPQLGAFTPALYEQAKGSGWTVVSMKDDWKRVFPFEPGPVTAINILLEPDATMLQHCEANNARLLKVFPKGFALDATHRPHVTLLQRFVSTAELDKIYAAAGKVLAGIDVPGLRMEAFKYYYIPSGNLGLAGIVAQAESGTARTAAGIDRCRGAVHRGNRRLGRLRHDAGRSGHRPAADRLRVGVCAEISRRTIQSARHHGHCAAGIPRQDARRAVRVVHLLAGRCRRLPTRPVRHGGEEAPWLWFDALRRGRRESDAAAAEAGLVRPGLCDARAGNRQRFMGLRLNCGLALNSGQNQWPVARSRPFLEWS